MTPDRFSPFVLSQNAERRGSGLLWQVQRALSLSLCGVDADKGRGHLPERFSLGLLGISFGRRSIFIRSRN